MLSHLPILIRVKCCCRSFQIYHKELEKVPEFKGFNDFIATFPLRRGKTKSKDDEDEDATVGEFKVSAVDDNERARDRTIQLRMNEPSNERASTRSHYPTSDERTIERTSTRSHYPTSDERTIERTSTRSHYLCAPSPC